VWRVLLVGTYDEDLDLVQFPSEAERVLLDPEAEQELRWWRASPTGRWQSSYRGAMRWSLQCANEYRSL